MVTTRSALLRAIIGMLFSATLVMTILPFFEFRRVMQLEMASNLQFSANAALERVDSFLLLQIQNVGEWRRLEVMQDLRVDDVDKRISETLADLKGTNSHTYRMLACTNTHGEIVAASDSKIIGQSISFKGPWDVVHRTPDETVSMSVVSLDHQQSFVLRTSIPDAFHTGVIGSLYVVVNGLAIQRLLDDLANRKQRDLLLTDNASRVITASSPLWARIGTRHLRLTGWHIPADGTVAYVHNANVLGFSSVFVVAAGNSDYSQIRDFGWHILIIEPTSVAFRPMWHLLWGMIALFLLIAGFGFWISSRLSTRIAQPIANLTEFTRKFRSGESLPPPVAPSGIVEVRELTAAYRDMIQALNQSRAALIRAGKLAVVGEMAAIMAHEIRTPLTIVRSSAQLLERESNHDEHKKNLIGFILSETERLNRLVTMLLECARPKAPDIKPANLVEIINSVVDLVASRALKANVYVHHEIDVDDPMLRCDCDQMMQVLLNLVLNALEFAPEGGKVVVSVHREHGVLWIAVSDDGPGVPADIRDRIFDPFFSRRQGGIGLGLTIVQQIIEAHGGTISVADSAWGGAAFNIRFPPSKSQMG